MSFGVRVPKSVGWQIVDALEHSKIDYMIWNGEELALNPKARFMEVEVSNEDREKLQDIVRLYR